jgi:spermidine synthase
MAANARAATDQCTLGRHDRAKHLMNPWTHVESARVPGSRRELHLYQRDEEFSIRVDDTELMNSRVFLSEDGFSELGCARIRGRAKSRVLIGGLGMGFSLKTALDELPADAQVIVAELVPEVAAWNRERFGHLNGRPLEDSRVSLREIDVACLLREASNDYDLVMLDVDNGPEGLTRRSNEWIYSRAGLNAARTALRPHGVLGFWSSGPNPAFVRRLHQAGFEVEENQLCAAPGCYGITHTVWLAELRHELAAADFR